MLKGKKKKQQGDYAEFPRTPQGRLLRREMLTFLSHKEPESVDHAVERLDKIVFALLQLKYGITGSIPVSYRVWNNTRYALKAFNLIWTGQGDNKDGCGRNKM